MFLEPEFRRPASDFDDEKRPSVVIPGEPGSGWIVAFVLAILGTALVYLWWDNRQSYDECIQLHSQAVCNESINH